MINYNRETHLACLSITRKTQFKPGLLCRQTFRSSNVIFLFVLSVCHYLWIIKFLEWAYRKKRGDMRGYFHRLGYWGFIFRLILLRFSFVFYINLPIRKSYRMVLSFRFWALWLLDFPDLSRLIPMHPPQYDGTINDCHTSERFDPPFSWEMPEPSREYDSCFLVSHLVMS